MKLVVAKKGKNAVRINKFFEFVLYVITYTIAFLILESSPRISFGSFSESFAGMRLMAKFCVSTPYFLQSI